jgi:hypothetical protein
MSNPRKAIAKVYGADQLTGWFAPEVKPHHAGVYRTDANPKTQTACWQHYNPATDTWGRFSGTPDGALALAGTPSKFQAVRWFGLVAPEEAQPA